jgi:hypothetical protein
MRLASQWARLELAPQRREEVALNQELTCPQLGGRVGTKPQTTMAYAGPARRYPLRACTRDVVSRW